jgi:hypothetical protein
MTEFDPVFAHALDRLAPAGAAAPDWADVIARSGRRGRRRAAWAAAVAVAAAALVVAVATPALGLDTPFRGLLGFDKRPRIAVTAKLLPVAGSGSGTFTASPPTVFAPVGRKRPLGFPLRIDYVLTFRGLSGPATEARLRVAPPIRGKGSGFVVRLCRPCRSPLRGSAQHVGLGLALLTGRITVEVATAAHPDGELRGQAMLKR